MPNFGNASKARLNTLCPELVEVAYDAIQVIDFSVIETVRGKPLQDKYFNSGTSTVQWPNSKHNVYDLRPLPEAMDLWPYVKPFGALSGHPTQVEKIAAETGRSKSEVREFIYKAFARMAGVIEACAHQRGYKVRWGGDWDGDYNLIDQKFHDLPHIELVK